MCLAPSLRVPVPGMLLASTGCCRTGVGWPERRTGREGRTRKDVLCIPERGRLTPYSMGSCFVSGRRLACLVASFIPHLTARTDIASSRLVLDVHEESKPPIHLTPAASFSTDLTIHFCIIFFLLLLRASGKDCPVGLQSARSVGWLILTRAD